MADISDSAGKYARRSILFLGAYVALNLAAMSGAFDDLEAPGAWLFAAAAAAPVLGHLWSLFSYIRSADEFVRGLMAKRLIVAMGICTAVVSAWGQAEAYAGAVHFPLVLFYPMLWAAYGLTATFIRSTRVCVTG